MLLIPVCPFSLIQSCPLFQMSTLRGSITEDSIPSSSKHGTSRRLPLKDVLEFVVPQLSIHSLRLAADSPRVPELLLQLDQQEVSSPSVPPTSWPWNTCHCHGWPSHVSDRMVCVKLESRFIAILLNRAFDAVTLSHNETVGIRIQLLVLRPPFWSMLSSVQKHPNTHPQRGFHRQQLRVLSLKEMIHYYLVLLELRDPNKASVILSSLETNSDLMLLTGTSKMYLFNQLVFVTFSLLFGGPPRGQYKIKKTFLLCSLRSLAKWYKAVFLSGHWKPEQKKRGLFKLQSDWNPRRRHQPENTAGRW